MSSQKGGYFPNEPNSDSGYYNINSSKLSMGNTAYGYQNAISYGVLTGNDNPNMVGPNLGIYPNSTHIQTGGNGNMDIKIINPETGRKVRINGKIGKRIFKKYYTI